MGQLQRAVLSPSLALWTAYRLGLRKWVNAWQQRRFDKDEPRAELPDFGSVDEAIAYISDAFDNWGSDRERGSWWSDWSSEPEVTEARARAARLDNDAPVGDCDDYAAWLCAAIAPLVKNVERLSVWTFDSGHTVPVYEDEDGFFVIDYKKIRVKDFEHAAEVVAARHGYKHIGWVRETPDLRFVASS